MLAFCCRRAEGRRESACWNGLVMNYSLMASCLRNQLEEVVKSSVLTAVLTAEGSSKPWQVPRPRCAAACCRAAAALQTWPSCAAWASCPEDTPPPLPCSCGKMKLQVGEGPAERATGFSRGAGMPSSLAIPGRRQGGTLLGFLTQRSLARSFHFPGCAVLFLIRIYCLKL